MNKHWLKKGWKIERQVRGALTWSFWSTATVQRGLPASLGLSHTCDPVCRRCSERSGHILKWHNNNMPLIKKAILSNFGLLSHHDKNTQEHQTRCGA